MLVEMIDQRCHPSGISGGTHRQAGSTVPFHQIFIDSLNHCLLNQLDVPGTETMLQFLIFQTTNYWRNHNEGV